MVAEPGRGYGLVMPAFYDGAGAMVEACQPTLRALLANRPCAPYCLRLVKTMERSPTLVVISTR